MLPTPLEGHEILTNAPLFVVPKEGQDGEWRVIMDMLQGGQNECITGAPVVLPQISHILAQMYANAYRAVVDALKYFHQFPTHPNHGPYLGLIMHPVTHVLYEYLRFPMDGAKSPGIACKYRLAFI